ALLRQSPRLPGAVGACLAAGASPEALVERLRADGPLRGRSPVGILLHRLQALAPVLAEERRAAETARLEGLTRWGRVIAGVLLAGDLFDYWCAREQLVVGEADPERRAIATAALDERLRETGFDIPAEESSRVSFEEAFA
ncbi:MAG: hypothetical protein ACRD0B_12655, partial [Acidimicrobiales bacterium]